jgi:hypothetical protein
MVQEDGQKQYQTADIYLAAWLRMSGLRLTDLHLASGRAFFRFSDTPERRELVRAFYSNEASISPRVLRDGIRDLKSMIRSSVKSPEPI